MSRRKADRPEPPCNHYDNLVGTVSAGNFHDTTSPFVSVVTCTDCAVKSAGYVSMLTGVEASPLLTYTEARAAYAHN